MQAAECQRFLFNDKTPWVSPRGLVVSGVPTPNLPRNLPCFFVSKSGCQAPGLRSRALTENVLFEFSCSPFFDPL